MDLESLRLRLGADKPWREGGGGLWLEPERLEPEEMARWMADAGGRLITVTAQPVSLPAAPESTAGDVHSDPGEVDLENGEFKLSYHWDLEGKMVTIAAVTAGGSIPSMLAFCPIADWIGREIHDLYSISFSGRGEIPPLMLRTGDEAGIFNPSDPESVTP